MISHNVKISTKKNTTAQADILSGQGFLQEGYDFRVVHDIADIGIDIRILKDHAGDDRIPIHFVLPELADFSGPRLAVGFKKINALFRLHGQLMDEIVTVQLEILLPLIVSTEVGKTYLQSLQVVL